MIKRVVVTKGLKARGYVDGRYVGEDKRESAREELLGKRRGKPAAGAKKRGGKRGAVVDGNTIAAAGKKARRGRGPATAQDALFRADGATAGAAPRKGRDTQRRNRAGKKTPFRPAFGAASASPSEVAEMRRFGGEARSGQFAEALAAQANVKRERLHKVLAQSGLGSRRDMEIMISSGRVMVNGIVATTGTQVGADDKVLVDHRPVVLKFSDELPRVLLYNKPEGEIVTTDDPGNRITVFDNLPKVEHGKWINIGRLDINTSGLLIFTTSGELANRFMHPRYEVEREYAVRLLGELGDEQRERLLAGVAIDDAARTADEQMQDEGPQDGGYAPLADDETAAFVASGLARFERIERREGEEGEGANHWYHVVLKEGRNREVRRMFETVGLTVSRLIRTRFGAVTLPPRLKRGMMLELSPDEVRRVLVDAGMAELAGAADGRSARRPKGRGARQNQMVKTPPAQPRGGASGQAADDRQPGSGEAKSRRNRRGRRGRPLESGASLPAIEDGFGNRSAEDPAPAQGVPAIGGVPDDVPAGNAAPGPRTGRRRMRRNFRGRNRRGPRKGGAGEPGTGSTSGGGEPGNS